MARRWARWIGFGVLLLVLLALGAWRALRGVPGHVELSLSPRRILSGLSPVSRVLVRTFSVQAGEANRTLLEKLRASGKEGGRDALPEVFLLDGDVRIGPMGPLDRWEAKVPEVRIRPVRFLGTRVSVEVRRAAGRFALPGGEGGKEPVRGAAAGC